MDRGMEVETMSDGPEYDRWRSPAEKPCCARINTKPITWCLLPADHVGDHEGVTAAEMPVNDSGPSRKPRWG